MEYKLLLDQHEDSVTPFDSVSQSSSISRKTLSSVGSQRLLKEQKKAELLARARALKRKQQLELNKLKLKQEELSLIQEEESLELNTELEVVSAQEAILSKYELHTTVPEASLIDLDGDRGQQFTVPPQAAEVNNVLIPTSLDILAQAAVGRSPLTQMTGRTPPQESRVTMETSSVDKVIPVSVTDTHGILSVINGQVDSTASAFRDTVPDKDSLAALDRSNQVRSNLLVNSVKPKELCDQRYDVSCRYDVDIGSGQGNETKLLTDSNSIPVVDNLSVGQASIYNRYEVQSSSTPGHLSKLGQGQGNGRAGASKLSDVRVGKATGQFSRFQVDDMRLGQDNDSSGICKVADIQADIPGVVQVDQKVELGQSNESPGFLNVCGNRNPFTHSSPMVGQSGTLQPNDVIMSMLRQMRKPSPDIMKFSGDPLDYNKFIRQFKSKVVMNADSADEMMTYLEQYTTGEANTIIQGYSYLDSDVGYYAALKELHDRYGNKDVVAQAFIRKALDWPIMATDKPKALDHFSIFLCECDNAVSSIDAVKILDYPDNLKKLVSKLPVFMHERWRGLIDRKRDAAEEVNFHTLAQFVRLEAKKANDPVYGKEALSTVFKQSHTGALKGHSGQAYRPANSSYSKASFATRGAEERKSPDYSSRPKKDGLAKPCMYCEAKTHALTECKQFVDQPHENKIELLKSCGLCFGCLKVGHQKRFCGAKDTCEICQGRHPTVLHIIREAQGQEIVNKVIPEEQTEDACSHMGAGNRECTMAVLPVKVRMKNGLKVISTYAFLDPGSNVSFCSEKLMHELGCTGKRGKITLDTMGVPHTLDTCVIKGLEICDLQLQNSIELPKVYTKSKIPVSKSHIPTNDDVHKWEHLADLDLPVINEDIGLLIGNNVPDAYTPLDLKTGVRGSPHATKTLLGWVAWNIIRETNKFGAFHVVNRAEVIAIQEAEELQLMNKLLQQSINNDFPEQRINDKRESSQEDKKFIKKMKSSIKLTEGHYEMNLPFRNDQVKVMNNSQMAITRLKGLQKKMRKNSKFSADYKEFMDKIITKGYAERVPVSEVKRNDGRVWYIPHHGVYHPKKPDKIRVVFDCAAVHNGISLNQLLLQGPDLTNNLIGVLERFRQEEVAIIADIEQMFYQVKVPKDSCDWLRFYWWPDGDFNSEPVVYRMLVHLFGAVSSPSCANYALHQTAKDHGNKFDAETVNSVFKNFYVDDLLKSVTCDREARGLVDQIRTLCKQGGFNLTKWMSNRRSVLNAIPSTEKAKDVKELDLECQDLPVERTLGIRWEAESDLFGFNVNLTAKPNTRRGILSVSSSVYDPLGFISPFVLRAKVILQNLCRKRLGWDEVIDEKSLGEWQDWCAELKGLDKVKIRRCFKPDNFGQVTNCELHNFSDASETAYGMVSYLRLQNDEGQVYCTLVIGKSRVAPLKKITVPRMELTAAYVAARMSKMIVDELEYKIDNVYFWTDSMSVLRYINNESTRFHTFVANRVSVIREATSVDQWRYVSTKHNPADIASRGISVDRLLLSDMWFRGPEFLWNQMENMEPNQTVNDLELSESDPEVRNISNVASVNESDHFLDKLIERNSSWLKLKRTVAWLLLGLKNLQKWVSKRKTIEGEFGGASQDKQQSLDKHMNKYKLESAVPANFIDVGQIELSKAEQVLIKHVQEQYFSEELKCGSNNHQVKRSSSLYKLDPYIVDDILRVGGRLDRADLKFDVKHPILLPKGSPLSRIIIRDIHQSVGHMGKNVILSVLREKYWIIGAGAIIKEVLAKCVICRKYRSKRMEQKMANLPQQCLIADNPPFTNVGMDYFGPFNVKYRRGTVKRYGVIFICFASRAVHIEMAYSLDTDSCVNAIRRLIARRGSVKSIRSDNGTNLVGACHELSKEIKKLNKEGKIAKKLQQKGIDWQFNPPAASHFGGAWERTIRSIRKILNGLMQQQNVCLNDELLQTLLCEVEAILNSRPITSLPNHPDDLEPLTPNHLLQQKPSQMLPPGVFSENENYSKRRWRQVQYLADLFWKRWSKEYLTGLQQRHKWQETLNNIAVDDIVLVTDNQPRNMWALGRITEIFKDKRGLARFAKVKTKSALLDRPISKLCLLVEADK